MKKLDLLCKMIGKRCEQITIFECGFFVVIKNNHELQIKTVVAQKVIGWMQVEVRRKL